ncbi:MAG: glycosyl transferase [Deinococcales bacterium]|nr:glycosyl transferase [Chitinophagaceae bacterium]
MKLAYLILAHANPKQLHRLVQKLVSDSTAIYIHIDAKVNLQDFLFIAQQPNVFFIAKREKVYWGAYSIVQATENGFEQIIASGINYQHITLLSGQDYPLKSNATIANFFKANADKAFMEYYSINNVWQEAIPRLNKYYLTNYPFAGSTKLETLINKLFPKRQPPVNLEFVGRSQWFSITLQQAVYIVDILKNNHSLRWYFKFTWGSDEFVFQTLLYNSPYKAQMVNDNLHYIDWTEGNASPKTFAIADAATLTQSDKLFARKFDEKIDVTIMNHLDNNSLDK